MAKKDDTIQAAPMLPMLKTVEQMSRVSGIGENKLRELMDRGLHTAPVNQYFGPGEYAACIDSSVQHFHPDYWKAREDGLTQMPKQIKMKEFER